MKAVRARRDFVPSSSVRKKRKRKKKTDSNTDSCRANRVARYTELRPRYFRDYYYSYSYF